MSSVSKVQHTVKCLNINVTNLQNTQIGNNNTLIVIRGIEEDNNENNNNIYPVSEVNLCSKDGTKLHYRARGPSTLVIGDNCTIAEIILNKELVKELETKGQFTVTKGDNLLSVTWYDDQDQKTDRGALKIKFLEDENKTDTTGLEKQVFELLADCQNDKLVLLIKEFVEKLKAKLKHVNMGCIELEFSLDSESGAGNFEDKKEMLKDILRRTVIPEGAVFDIEILPPQRECDDRSVATGTVSSTPSYEESSIYNVEEKSRDTSVDKTINLEDEELGIESTFQEMTTRDIKPIDGWTLTEPSKEEKEEKIVPSKSNKIETHDSMAVASSSSESQEPKDDEKDKVSVMKYQTKDLVISEHKHLIPYKYDSLVERYMEKKLNQEIDDVRRMLEIEVEGVTRHYWKMGREEARDCRREINNAIFTELDRLPTKLCSLIESELETEWKRIEFRIPIDYNIFRYDMSIYGAIIDKLSLKESLWSILPKIKPVIVKADNITDIIKSLEIEIQMVTDQICSKTKSTVRAVMDEWVTERGLKRKSELRQHLNWEIDDVRRMLEREVEDVARHYWKMGREEARDCRREINNATFTELDNLPTKLCSLIESELETEWKRIEFRTTLDYNTFSYVISYGVIIDTKLSLKESLWSILPKIKPVIVKVDKNNITDIIKSIEIEIQKVTDQICSKTKSTVRALVDEWVTKRGVKRINQCLLF